MKFSIELKALTEALGVVGRAVAGKGIRPILANVLVTARQGELRLVGTDMEVIMISRLPSEIEAEGDFTIPARLLSEVVGSIPTFGDNSKVTFAQLDDDLNKIRVSCGSARYDLQVQGIDDFPPVPNLEGESFPIFEIPSADLKRCIKEVAIAMGLEDGNPSQRSICMNFAKESPAEGQAPAEGAPEGSASVTGKIVLVATDSKRLAVSTLTNVSFPPEMERTFLVPSRAEPELIKLLDDAATVQIGLFNNQLIFISPQFQLLTRLIDAKFPDYTRVLPKECSRSMSTGRKELTQALKAILPIAKHSSYMVHLDIGLTEARIWAESKEQGLSECVIPVTLSGEPLNIAFNVVFLQEFLSVIEEETVVMEMTTPSYPGLLRKGGDDRSFQYVVMPMTF